MALLAVALVGIAFLTHAHEDVDLLDEGYLWYGAIAVTEGQVPMRDFDSYDPGRYYWVAPWLLLIDRGLVPLRLACFAFHLGGVACGLLVVRRLTRSWWALAGAGGLITLWLIPAYMLNHTVALIGVWVAVLLIERRSLARHVLAGAYVGVATFFGRHLGLYAFVSFVLLQLVLWWKVDRRDGIRRALAFAGGGLLGYAPMLVMLAVVPGYRETVFDVLRRQLEQGTTNLARPVPWPWLGRTAWDVAVGVFFVAAPLFYALAAGWVALADGKALVRRRVLLGAALVGAPYLHYAFSRADIQHLAMGIHPLLLGLLALPFAIGGRLRPLAVGLVAGVGALSLVAAGQANPYYQRVTAPAGWYVPFALGRWTMWTPWPVANFLRGAIRFNATMVRPDEGFLIIPKIGPGLYAILGRESPVWQIYFIHPHPEWWQRRMIDELERKHVDWVLYEDVRTDGRPELTFPLTHRLMWEYIQREFEAVPVDGLPPNVSLLARRGTAPAS
ncbi:MAG TPA: hypothetical protein VKA21_00100 [Candidatus Binatia bacterium]|nr:hypothetical protein [Candidatus Binatia bacterium]